MKQLKYGMIPGFGTLGGLSDMRESAKELDAFIQKVLTATATTTTTTNASSASTQKVDIVAHSEGAAVARYYLKFLDRQTKQEQQQQQQQEQQEEEEEFLQERPGRVRSLVSIAPVGKGTSVLGLLAMTQILGIYDFLADTVQQYCVACVQILEGSDFMQELYGDDGLQAEVPGVRYLNVITNRDRAVTPFTNGVMDIPEPPKFKGVNGATKTEVEAPPLLQNLVLENHCDSNPDQSDHCGIFQSPFALHATYAFLASDSGTIDTNIPCTFSTDGA
ncbi:hypothetical protein BGZ97_006110 [Linnemannia gamsii]|jgi:triacylglycerol esterase/lipase EstA (alpha/beta hydrolase family)|uniref:Alpha/beta-hydrolase n=1 Tax=Linnemannia gamsii TaxID=64522 RepID=A0A9P6UEV2_9FUNG|nr:hypothetical protein BGZ97_006110 [Linnemannia gamsii]